MAKLIALCGPQQVGKTTAANSLVNYHSFRRVAFADPLYRMAGALLDMSVGDVRQLPKNEPLEALQGKTLRFTLQTLGTEWGRNTIGDGIWRTAAIDKIQKYLNAGISVVVDDCRFRDECDSLIEIGAKVVRLSREDMPEQENTSHGSEADWPHFPVDASVLNPSDGVKNWSELAGKAILAALDVQPSRDE